MGAFPSIMVVGGGPKNLHHISGTPPVITIDPRGGQAFISRGWQFNFCKFNHCLPCRGLGRFHMAVRGGHLATTATNTLNVCHSHSPDPFPPSAHPLHRGSHTPRVERTATWCKSFPCQRNGLPASTGMVVWVGSRRGHIHG